MRCHRAERIREGSGRAQSAPCNDSADCVRDAMSGPEPVPRIDVVIPVYNKLAFLSQAVGSVVEAVDAHGAACLWLVDNGSSDGSYEVLVERFANRANVLRLSSGTIAA